MNTTAKYHIIAVAAIMVIGVALYANILNNEFVYNDYQMVADNSFITSWNNIKSFFSDEYFLGSAEATYRPMVTLTFFLDYALWEYKPFGYHLTNMIFHVLNGIMFYCMLTMLVPITGRRFSAGEGGVPDAFIVPLAAALLFISHPVMTEGVVSVGSRHELVTTFFYLASICLYLGMKTARGMRKPLFYVLSLASYFFAMMAKEIGITVPAILVLIDLYASEEREIRLEERNKTRSPNILLYSGYAAVALLYLYIRFVAMTHPVKTIEDHFAPSYLSGGNFYLNFLTCMTIMKTYIGLLFMPVRLSLEYIVKPVKGLFSAEAAFSTAVVAGVMTAAFVSRRRFPLMFFGWAWFFIAILPVSNLIVPLTSTRMAERFLYLPAVGYCIFLAAALRAFAALEPGNVPPVIVKKTVLAAAAVILLLYSVKTVRRNMDWQDNRTFWEKEAKTEHESFRTHNNLAMQYYYAGEKEKAVEELKVSLGLSESAQTRVNLGFVYLESGELEKAESEFRKAISDDVNYASAYYHLGLAASKRGDGEKALEFFEEALKKYPLSKDRPFESDAHNAFGVVLARKGLKDKAVEEYIKALAIRPDFSEARYNLAKAYLDMGAFDKAAGDLEKVVKSDPANADAAMALGYAYIKLGLDEKASAVYETALKARPEDIQLNYLLAGTYLKMKAFDKAEKQYLAILKIDPKHVDARNNLANVYYTRGMVDKAMEEYEKTLETEPSHFQARNNLANLYLMKREFDRAIEEYRKVLGAQPGNTVVRYNLGLAYEGKGMFAEAEKEWEEVLRVDPTFLPAAEALRRHRGEN